MRLLAVGSLFLLALALEAASIHVHTVPNFTENAGNSVAVDLEAWEIPEDQTCEVRFVDSATHSISELVISGIPISNGINAISFDIPWSWWPVGRYHIQITSTIDGQQVSGMGEGIIRVRSAIIWPYGKTVINRGWGSWVTWTTESAIDVDFMRVYIRNVVTGKTQLVSGADHVQHSAGRYLWRVPNVKGSYRILIEGYRLLGDIEQPVEFTQSEIIKIQ